MSKQPQLPDRKTELTYKTIEGLKASSSTYNEFVKAANSYAKALQKASEAGRQFADAIQKVGLLHNGDLGSAIGKLADIQRQVETRNETVARLIADDLAGGIQRNMKPEEAEISNFENDYKKAKATTRAQIAKLEEGSKKAGKKGPEVLKQAIQALNDKVKEAEQIKSDKLRQALLIERKKYCTFLSLWVPVITAQLESHKEGERLKEQESSFKQLASSSSSLSADLEGLIKSNQERTFVAIQSSGSDDYSYSYGGGSGGNTNDSWSGYDSGNYDYGTPSSSYGTSNFGTATALYDYAGQQADDLSFYAGEVITVLQEDDGSGWLYGELNGIRGIFPATYVQRN